MSRPFSAKSFNALEEIYKKNRSDELVLNQLLDELSKRKKNKKIPNLIENVKKSLVAAGLFRNTKVNANHTCNSSCVNESDDSNGGLMDDIATIAWDKEQRSIIELDEDSNKIVEAGPGSGKTAVACARVAWLIEECSLEASKILLISFTRTAVKELKIRIENFSKNPINVSGLQIFTLDSFTWQILRGLGDEDKSDLMVNYETNIRNFIQKLKEGDAQLLDYIAEFEHVVLDEGQDLVGIRADLAMQIFSNLEKGCGVTIFSDSAQAIYGFTNDFEQHGADQSLTVVERIMSGEIEGFDRQKLLNVHRTKDLKLKKLFTEGRDRLLDRKESNVDSWKQMKALICDCSHGTVDEILQQDLRGKTDRLVLFRTRAEVLMASSYLWSNGTVHKLRMSGTPQTVLPWIGRILGEINEDYLDRNEFEILWDEKVADDVHTPSQLREQAWQLLLDNVGNRDELIKLTRLREILARDRPPIDFLIDEATLAGPVLGTIHASKGREANQVHLMLPPDTFMVDDPDSDFALSSLEIAEEERVLFVGATRAKHRLLIGNGRKMYASRYDERRTYKKPKKYPNARMIEVGLSHDIDLISIASGQLQIDAAELQNWLWQHATSQVHLEVRYDFNLKRNVLWAKDDNLPIAFLSQRFDNDLWGIAKVIGNKIGDGNYKPAPNIKNIHMTGVTTIAMPQALREQLKTPWRHSGFILAPVITGFPMVFFNRWKGI